MLPRFLNLARSNVVNSLRKRVHRSMANAPVVKETCDMNTVPIPHEPFEVGYKRRQVGNNAVLLLGIVFFSCTLAFVSQSGLIFLNLTPPKKNLGEN